MEKVVYLTSAKCVKEGQDCVLYLCDNNGEEVKVITHDYGDDLTCLEEGKMYGVRITEYPEELVRDLHSNLTKLRHE